VSVACGENYTCHRRETRASSLQRGFSFYLDASLLVTQLRLNLSKMSYVTNTGGEKYRGGYASGPTFRYI